MSEIVGRQAPTVRSQDLGEELSLFDTATGRALALNGTARDIWTLVDGESTTEELVAELAAAYRVDPADIDADVRAALAQLTAAGVVVPPER